MKQKIISFFHRKEFYTALIATFILGIIAHGFVMTNYNFNHDSLTFAFSEDFIWKISLGRFMQPISSVIRGNIHVPWLIGIFSMIYIALTTYLLTKMFKITKKLYIIGISGILVTNTILSITNATYMHEADSFMLSLLLSVLAVYLFDKNKFSFLLSSVFLMMSIGLYQAYFQIALLLFIIIIFLKALKNNPLKEIIKYFGKVVLTFILAFILYYLIHKLTLVIFDITIIDSYNSVNNIYSIINIGIFRDLYDSVMNSMSFYFLGATYNFGITTIIYALSAVMLLLIIIRLIIKHKLTKSSIVVVIISAIAFICSLNIIYILSGGFTHHLMVYSICMPLVLLIIVISKENNKILQGIGIFVIFAVIYTNIIYSNQLYLKKDIEYNATHELYSRIVSDIEEIEGYIPNQTPVVFAGHFDYNDNYQYLDLFSHINEMGTMGKQSITYKYTYQQWNDFLVNSPLNIIIDDDLIITEEVVEMPLYPYQGSIKIVNDTVVVKISNENYTG